MRGRFQVTRAQPRPEEGRARTFEQLAYMSPRYLSSRVYLTARFKPQPHARARSPPRLAAPTLCARAGSAHALIRYNYSTALATTLRGIGGQSTAIARLLRARPVNRSAPMPYPASGARGGAPSAHRMQAAQNDRPKPPPAPFSRWRRLEANVRELVADADGLGDEAAEGDHGEARVRDLGKLVLSLIE